jgi:hypothetical protein
MGYKLTNYPRFGEMQNMFKDKGSQTIESKPTIEVKIVATSFNMVDVNVTIRSKMTENQVFKDQEPQKKKFVEKKLKKYMVETIH